MLLECAAKCQDLYKVNISANVTGRVEGGETTFLFRCFSLSELRAADIRARLISLPVAISQVVCFCRVFNDRVGVGVCILWLAAEGEPLLFNAEGSFKRNSRIIRVELVRRAEERGHHDCPEHNLLLAAPLLSSAATAAEKQQQSDEAISLFHLCGH